jgi:tetratricopeptide (TPR) repeat protein
MLDRIEASLRRHDIAAALELATAFQRSRPRRPEGYILLGRCRQQMGDAAGACLAAAAAKQLAPGHPGAILLSVECRAQLGQTDAALSELGTLADAARNQPRVLQDAGRIYSHMNRHAEAERCYALAAGLTPSDPQALYNWATCLIALGRLREAEDLLTQVIALAPEDYDAYYNRSTLRRQTAEHNHVAQLRLALERPGLTPPAAVALGYALAKELEDLGHHPESFAALHRAAQGRRRLLSYRVADDVAAMEEIARQFDANYGRRANTAGSHARPTADAVARPIFIVGLPRSGTTLVDRILSSHSQVESRGESSDLAAAVMQAAGPVGDKFALIRRVATLDPESVGANYLARLPASGRAYVIDKTPINFLYLGLIAAALPRARIIHVRREAADVCYAMYKTLFRMAYPFSYDLGDLGRYYRAYAQLMQHWRNVLPTRFIEVDYEHLVADQDAVTRKLLEACGLPWEAQVLNFHDNPSPSLTASAAQVRQPIYSSSVGLWRRYETELTALLQVLDADADADAGAGTSAGS